MKGCCPFCAKHIFPFLTFVHLSTKKILIYKNKYVCIQKLKYPRFNVDHRLKCGGRNISKFLGLYAMSYSSLVLYSGNLLWLRKAMRQEAVNFSHCLKVDWQLNIVFCTNYERKNPAYGRHQLSRPMRIVGPIQI